MTLVDAKPGQRVVVHGVTASASRIDKLASLGILPGVELVVHQRKPVFVVESGESVLALEHELAMTIEVAPYETETEGEGRPA
jgi:DtxR family Mn-dependent transcriptional regulator